MLPNALRPHDGAWPRRLLPSDCRAALPVLFAALVSGCGGERALDPLPGRPPALVRAIPDQVVGVGQTATLDASSHFTDPDGDPLRYEASSSDPSVADASYSGPTVTITALRKGFARLTITASDPAGLTTSLAFQVTVPNRPPTPALALPDQTIYIGQTATLDPSAHFTDPDGDALSFQASSSNPSVVDASLVDSLIDITAPRKGVARVTITASDPAGLTSTQVFLVTVPNRPPTPALAVPDQTIHIGQTVTLDPSAHFTDPDGDALSFQASSSNPSVADASVSGTTVTVTALAKGEARITVTARDSGGLDTSQAFQIAVLNQAPEPVGRIPGQAIHVGEAVTLDAAPYFSDPDSDALAFQASSSNPAVATVLTSGSAVTVTALGKGSATVTITASDPEGLTTTQTVQVTVPNRGPEPLGSIPRQAIHVGEAVTLDAKSYFSEPDGDALAFQASSSNPAVATVLTSGSAVTVTALRKGSATVTITASDPEGLTATQPVQVVVPNRGPEPVGAVPDQTIDIGEAVALDAASYFTDPDGDVLTFEAVASDLAVATVFTSGSTVTVTALAKGAATVTIRASDPQGLAATQDAQVIVRSRNRAPGPVGTIPVHSVLIGETVTMDVSPLFTDPDGDALSFQASSSDPSVATASATGTTATLTALREGTTDVTLTATDPEGLWAAQAFQVTVSTNTDTNRPPRPAGAIPDQSLRTGETTTLDAEPYFTDPDGDALSFQASSSDPSVATASVSGATVTVTAGAEGSTTISVSASDPAGLEATLTGDVTVTGPQASPASFYLVQSVQNLQSSVPLVAGKQALLRVFMTVSGGADAPMPPVRATFYSGGVQTYQTEIPGTSHPIPTVIDESALSKSANARIPARVIRPGLEVVVEPDPDGTLDPALGVAPRMPATGRMAVAVHTMPAFNVTIVPMLWQPNPDSSVITLVNAMAADPENHEHFEHSHLFLPILGLGATAHAPVVTSTNHHRELLDHVQLIRAAEGGRNHYLGIMSVKGPTIRGSAEVGGWSSYTDFASYSNSRLIAHEFGHNMSLLHVPCGPTGFFDPDYPYEESRIGAWGYNFNSDELVPPTWLDFMGYCNPNWTSDYHFTKALHYRLAHEAPSAHPADHAPTTSGRALIVWGGLDEEGAPTLRPSFLIDARPTLPKAGGPWSLTGTDAAGRELFFVSFTMPETAHADDRAGFSFAVPVTWGERELARMMLRGPGGSSTLDGDTDLPMVLLRDPETGEIRGILDGSPEPAPSPFGARDRAESFQTLFSRGVPAAHVPGRP